MTTDEQPPMTDAEAWIVALVQATQDAVITIDSSGLIDQFNSAAERMFGYAATEVRGQDVSILMPEPYRAEHAGYVARYERTGQAHAIGRIRTIVAVRKNGEEFPAELSVTVVHIRAGRRYGAFLRDISANTKLQDELVQRERLVAIGTTAAKFAHEVANPLNGMYTHAQLLKRRLDRSGDGDPRIVAGVESLLRDIERLNGLLLEFRAMSRRQEFRLTATNVAHLCQELLETERESLADRGATLRTEFPPDLPQVRADAPKLKQVLLNLCKNAVEAMPQGGEILLRGKIDGATLVLTMRDRGVGIAEGFDAFAPFATTKPAGTGLGLAIVRDIVGAHGGTITHAPAEGGGTEFAIVLPIDRP